MSQDIWINPAEWSDQLGPYNCPIASICQMAYSGLGHYYVICHLNPNIVNNIISTNKDKRYFTYMIGGSNGYDVQYTANKFNTLTLDDVKLQTLQECKDEILNILG